MSSPEEPRRAPYDTSLWPQIDFGPQGSIFAIGVIAMTYYLLEGVLRSVFTATLEMPRDRGSVIFHRIQNDVRLAIIKDVATQRKLPPPLLIRLDHFTSGFAICADNRNALLHSGSSYPFWSRAIPETVDELPLTRRTRSGEVLHINVDETVLRRVATEMMGLNGFGGALYGHIPTPFPLDFEPVPPLPDIPELPFALDYRSQQHGPKPTPRP